MFQNNFDDLRNIMDACNNDVYNLLHNIMRALKNPNTFENIIKSKIPF